MLQQQLLTSRYQEEGRLQQCSHMLKKYFCYKPLQEAKLGCGDNHHLSFGKSRLHDLA
jgi:hypothetical protein